jgi:radical SAM protein with 4Fe4S-binding SPASM domain
MMSYDAQNKISGKRQPLAKILPTELPLSVNICVSEHCNLRCEFCKHSNDEKNKKLYTKEDIMKPEVVRKLAEDFKKYSYPKLKQAVLAGGGEPLINSDIDKMVSDLSESVSDRVAIVTNGTLLTKELSCRLLDAGLDVLRVSLNGLNVDDYKKYTGKFVDVDELYENIRFFKEETERRASQGKKRCLVYVKIMNYMVTDDERKNEFFDRWKNVSDIQNIENLNITSSDVDFNSISDVDFHKGRYGQEVSTVPKVCPRPFIDCVVRENGDVLTCCNDIMIDKIPDEDILGNIMDDSLANIWNNRKFTHLRKALLSGEDMPEICRKCEYFQAAMSSEDVLDKDADRLFEIYDRMERKGEK